MTRSFANRLQRPSWSVIVGVILLVSALGVAAAIWWPNLSEVEFDRETALNLGIVMESGGESLGAANILISPAEGGDEAFLVEYRMPEGVSSPPPDQLRVTLTGLNTGETVGPMTFAVTEDLVTEPQAISMSKQQMWQADVAALAGGESIASGIAGFFVPDPNRFGNDSIQLGTDNADAQSLFEQGAERLTGLHRVRYNQWFTDGNGLAVVSLHAISDGSDGGNVGFTYLTPGGLDAVVIGTDLWSRKGDEPWKKSSTNPPIMPSEWMEEYSEATGFQLGVTMDLPQGTCQYITFEAPEISKRSVAWYAWCVDPETGALYRDLMVSRDHYMTSDFFDHDEEIEIQEPV